MGGDLTRVARGLLDRGPPDRYLAESHGGRTRVWAEHTAWGAIALLSGRPQPRSSDPAPSANLSTVATDRTRTLQRRGLLEWLQAGAVG